MNIVKSLWSWLIMEVGKHEKLLTIFVVLLVVVAVVVAVLVLLLLVSKDPGPDQRSKTIMVAINDLPAFTLLTKENVKLVYGDQTPPDVITVSDVENHYLLVSVKQGQEVRPEMVLPRVAPERLRDTVAVAVPSTSITTLGGHIKPGDVIELMAVQKKKDGDSIPHPNPTIEPLGNSKTHADVPGNARVFEGMVLSLVARKEPGEKDAESGAIILAVPRERRYECVLAVAEASLLVTRLLPK